MFLNDFLMKCAEGCDKIALKAFIQNMAVENKLGDGFDPVTVTDRAVETYLREMITSHYPDHGIIGEEFGSEKTDAEYVWILDPIDGTRNFLTGLIGWGCLMGLYKNGLPYMGMLVQPVTSERFIGTLEKTTRIWANGQFENQILSVSKTTKLSEALLHISTDQTFQEQSVQPLHDELVDRAKLYRGHHDCYSYGMLAAGRLDICIDYGVQLYDFAAITPIVRGAGGVVSYWRTGESDLGYSLLAASTQQLHDEALEIIGQYSHIGDLNPVHR